MSVTILLIAVTVIISFLAFSNEKMLNELLLWPARIHSPLQYYRLLTSGFVHADQMHLAFNMITLYFFGDILENPNYGIGGAKLLLLYLSGIVVAGIPSFIKHRNQPGYRSLGASGGVAAIVFAMIYIFPWQNIYLFFSLPIPCILYAILYLVYTAYMARRGNGRVNHDAHFWGSVYGVLFMLIIIDPSHGAYFWEQLRNPPAFFRSGR